jgi:hypothetical protein
MSIAPAERVETSLEEIQVLDFEPRQICERHEAMGAVVSASWYLHRSCKCRINTICNECKASAEMIVMLNGDFQCKPCGVDPVTIRFEPIK